MLIILPSFRVDKSSKYVVGTTASLLEVVVVAAYESMLLSALLLLALLLLSALSFLLFLMTVSATLALWVSHEGSSTATGAGAMGAGAMVPDHGDEMLLLLSS